MKRRASKLSGKIGMSERDIILQRLCVVNQSNLVELKAWRKKGKKRTKRLLTYLASLL
jgi:hypothetical protein